MIRLKKYLVTFRKVHLLYEKQCLKINIFWRKIYIFPIFSMRWEIFHFYLFNNPAFGNKFSRSQSEWCSWLKVIGCILIGWQCYHCNVATKGGGASHSLSVNLVCQTFTFGIYFYLLVKCWKMWYPVFIFPQQIMFRKICENCHDSTDRCQHLTTFHHQLLFYQNFLSGPGKEFHFLIFITHKRDSK